MSHQVCYWLGTLYDWTPPTALPPGVNWLKGQQETCPTTGRLHHQVIVGFARKSRLATVKRVVGVGHWEPTRSDAADAYVHKEDTRVEGTQFELGHKVLRRNVSADWDAIKEHAKAGNFEEIPSDVYIRHYFSLQRIAADSLKPTPMERECFVFWGRTGTGKSRKAWDEAGLDAFIKNPRTKWWDGYRGQEHVIIDEFRGSIDIAYLLLWLDRYPCVVEIKGGSRPLCAKKIWITSNLNPRTEWFPDEKEETMNALVRRLNITHFN